MVVIGRLQEDESGVFFLIPLIAPAATLATKLVSDAKKRKREAVKAAPKAAKKEVRKAGKAAVTAAKAAARSPIMSASGYPCDPITMTGGAELPVETGYTGIAFTHDQRVRKNIDALIRLHAKRDRVDNDIERHEEKLERLGIDVNDLYETIGLDED